MADLNDSILDITKQLLSIEVDDTTFDLDIITHINSVFFTLNQLSVGPAGGFFIVDRNAKWTDYIGADQINAVKSYMALKVRLLFDPPATSYATDAMKRQTDEFEWRLNVHMEGVRHPDGITS